MGIYVNRGVEYLVYLSNNSTYKTIAGMPQTDARLEASRFYAARRHEWFQINNSQIKKIDDPDFDVELTREERERLDDVLAANKDCVVDHGWYDVVSVGDTYGI